MSRKIWRTWRSQQRFLSIYAEGKEAGEYAFGNGFPFLTALAAVVVVNE
jgi:hypothetical protein